jgi:catalase
MKRGDVRSVKHGTPARFAESFIFRGRPTTIPDLEFAVPATDWKETIPPNEPARLEEIAQQFGALQQKFAHGGAVSRGAHAKGVVGVKAQLIVLPDLPEAARLGLFAAPATFEGWVRFSNAGPGHGSDRNPDIRGFALKILGVPGRKLIPGMEEARTQDLLFINTPRFSFRTADEFAFFTAAAASPLTLLPKVIGRMGFGRTLSIVKSFSATAKPIPSVSGQQYWTVAPIRWGAYAAKLSVIPVVPNPPTKKLPKTPNYLREELTERLAKGPVEYDLAVQFYADAEKTPIEDPTVLWAEDVAPFTKIARLTLPQQELRGPAGEKQAAYIEKLSFDPWHAPVEFRPLGNIMRARNSAYRVSTLARGAAKEPEGSKAVAE